VRFRGRLQLLYDEVGNLKCETCFPNAPRLVPSNGIDMGGHDTKNRFYTHWGPAETYGERREESALRRRDDPFPTRPSSTSTQSTLVAVEEILEARDYDARDTLALLEQIQESLRLPARAVIKHVSHVTGAPYALVYGTATYYRTCGSTSRAEPWPCAAAPTA